MSYQALARKWRPRQFSDLVGQEHVLRALVHALDSDRLHHAYLFTGTRGVGKTTIARIFAKALNCEQGVSSTPCGTCGTCKDIDAGRFVDLIEVDAASRTKVDDTRELLENVQYTPTRGRYKVYLIDEVHMLSAHSFNALLKTLEEPPPHVKFLFATTDPQRLPVTVLSRCLQFNLKRLPEALIRGRLEAVAGSESIDSEAGALDLLARAADGSLRDGLSLLDQAAAFGDGRLETGGIAEMLGTLDTAHVLRILDAVAAGDASAVLAEIAHMDERAPDYSAALDQMATLTQQIAVAQLVPDAASEEDARRLAALFTPEDVQLNYEILLRGKGDLHLAPSPRLGFEMIMLRLLAFAPAGAGVGASAGAQPLAAAASGRAAGPAARRKGARANRGSATPGAGSAAHRPAPDAAANAAPQAPTEVPPEARQNAPAGQDDDTDGQGEALSDWSALVDALNLKGMARQLANNCQLAGRDGNSMQLLLDASQEHLLTDTLKSRLTLALSRHLGREIRVRIDLGEAAVETPARRDQARDRQRQEEARASIETDPNVRAMQETFGATVEPNSIRPLD